MGERRPDGRLSQGAGGGIRTPWPFWSEQPARRKSAPKVSAAQAEQYATEMLAGRWATSYREDLHRTWATYEEWRHGEHLVDSNTTKVLFVAAMARERNLLPSSTLALAKRLSAATAIGQEPTLSDLAAALRRGSAEIPTRQAAILDEDGVDEVIAAVEGIGNKAAIELALLTASRWDDIQTVCPNDLVVNLDASATLTFRRTKAARLQPWRADHRVHISALSPNLLAAIATQAPDKPFTNLTTAQLNKKLEGTPFTAHSLKRTAVGLLFRAASTGEIAPDLVRQMAKHKDLETTIRYAPSQVDVATAMGTAPATAVLAKFLARPERAHGGSANAREKGADL